MHFSLFTALPNWELKGAHFLFQRRETRLTVFHWISTAKDKITVFADTP